MKIDWHELSNAPGYKKLKAAVMWDIAKDVQSEKRHGFSIRRGFKLIVNSSENEYSSKFKWIIDRAKHYSHVTGVPIVEILNAWENHRNCWYMNYYQDSQQPKLKKGSNIFIFDTVEEINKLVDKGFRCPACGGISKHPNMCDAGTKVDFSKSGICDWKSFGLFGTLGKGAFIFVKEEARGMNVFMPVALEK